MKLNIAELPAFIGRYLLTLQVTDYLDIAIMAFLLYKVLTLVRSTKAASLVKGVFVFLAALVISSLFHLNGIYYILSRLVQWGVLALIILFQPEIRRILEQMGSRRVIAFFTHTEAGNVMEQTISQTVLACTEMSQTRTGVLIVFEREILLDDMVRSGTVLDASVSSELLKNIFFVKAPMHDGAVIVRHGRVLGAGCMLPLSKNVNLSRDLGMRHRAGIGMSENSDAVVVIVSEETGSISVAIGGMLKRHLKPETLENLLRNELLPQEAAESDKQKNGLLGLLRVGKKEAQMMSNEKIHNKWKALYLLLAVFVAAFAWFYVDIYGAAGPQLVEKTITDIPLEYANENLLADRGMMLVEEGSDTTIDLKLQATRSVISNLDRSKIQVTVDLNNVTRSGTQTLGYSVYYVGRSITGQKLSTLPITKKDASISSATVNIQELYSKTVDVKCELKGSVAEGYTAGELQLSHTSIDIWGQEADIAPVSYAKVTLDIGSAESTVNQALPIQFYDQHGHVVETGIRTTVEEIQAMLPVSVTKELRLKIDFQDAPGARLRNMDVDLQPKTILVSGDAAQLKDIDSITLTDFDLLSLEPGTNTYVYPISVPNGCTNLSGVTQATLKIAYKDMVSAQVTTDQFRYENIPAGKNVDIRTEEMTVSIFGTAADVAAVTGENVTVVADLSDYSAASGSYTVPATVEIKTSGDVGVSGTYQVQVVIREPNPPQEDNTGEEA